MGCKGHRHFISHSPILWAPIFFGSFYVLNTVMGFGKNILLGFPLLVLFGMGLGYMSHLLGDAFTLTGIPLLPVGAEFNPIKDTLGRIPIIKNLPKANNPVWTKLFLAAGIDALLCILFPDIFIDLNIKAWNGLGSIADTISNTLKTVIPAMFKGLFGIISTIVRKK